MATHDARGFLALEVFNDLANVAVVSLASKLEYLVDADLEILAFIDLAHINADFEHFWVAVLVVANVITLRMVKAFLIHEFLEQ